MPFVRVRCQPPDRFAEWGPWDLILSLRYLVGLIIPELPLAVSPSLSLVGTTVFFLLFCKFLPCNTLLESKEVLRAAGEVCLFLHTGALVIGWRRCDCSGLNTFSPVQFHVQHILLFLKIHFFQRKILCLNTEGNIPGFGCVGPPECSLMSLAVFEAPCIQRGCRRVWGGSLGTYQLGYPQQKTLAVVSGPRLLPSPLLSAN